MIASIDQFEGHGHARPRWLAPPPRRLICPHCGAGPFSTFEICWHFCPRLTPPGQLTKDEIQLLVITSELKGGAQ